MSQTGTAPAKASVTPATASLPTITDDPCKKCNGEGKVLLPLACDEPAVGDHKTTCGDCMGSGLAKDCLTKEPLTTELADDPCKKCNGEGKVLLPLACDEPAVGDHKTTCGDCMGSGLAKDCLIFHPPVTTLTAKTHSA